MNTETAENKIELIQTVKKREDLLGIWRLKYKLTNRMGPGGFTVRSIDSYTDPLTGKPRHLYNDNGQQQQGYIIEKQTTMFEPRTNRQHAHIVDFLLGHPGVFVEREHANLDAAYVKAKNSNPRITLTNLSYQDLSEIKDEDYIDKLVGIITLDIGTHAISITKLRFILAKLNLKYRDDQHFRNEKAEKPKLRKRLKDYVRIKKENAEEVNLILENLTNAQYEYEIKEMIRLGIVNNEGGTHRYEGVSLGVSISSVITYFTNNVDFYGEVSEILYSKLKEENE